MARFTAPEIASIAVKIEENGKLLYEKAAAAAGETEEAALFSKLARDEEGHKATFGGFLKSLAGRHTALDFPGDRVLYVQAVADAAAFTEEAAAEVIAGLNDAGPDAVFDFALDREHETILFYQTIRDFLPRKDRDTVSDIIKEEERHVALLEDLRASTAKPIDE